MDGPGDPWNLQQLALGSPFKCFQLWRGVRETLPCKKNSQKNKNNGTLKKESHLVQNGFQKPGYKSESKAQGQRVGESGEWGLGERGVGAFGLQTLGCAFGLARGGGGSWEARGVDRLPRQQGTGVPRMLPGSESSLPLGCIAAKGLPLSPEAAQPR